MCFAHASLTFTPPGKKIWILIMYRASILFLSELIQILVKHQRKYSFHSQLTFTGPNEFENCLTPYKWKYLFDFLTTTDHPNYKSNCKNIDQEPQITGPAFKTHLCRKPLQFLKKNFVFACTRRRKLFHLKNSMHKWWKNFLVLNWKEKYLCVKVSKNTSKGNKFI